MKPVIKVTTSTILRAVNPSFSSISSIIKARRGPKNILVKVNRVIPTQRLIESTEVINVVANKHPIHNQNSNPMPQELPIGECI